MSTFGIKCPGCEILLEADENDIGAKVECTECGRPFILARNPDPSSAETANDTVTFTFDAFPKDLDYSQPLFLTMPNGTFPVESWSNVLEKCFSYAFANNAAKVGELVDIKTPFRKAVLISRHPERLRRAKELGGDLYMETNLSAHGIVKSVCGLMAYCGFPVKAFSVTYRVKSSEPPAPESKVDAPVSSSEFSKPLDFSTFTTGITIPVRVHEAFLKHLSVKLERGKSHPVTIMVGDSSFQVSINNIGFSDPNRKQVLAFLWRKNSPLAKSFQATFTAAYQQLMEDHANRTGIDTVLTVSCGEQPDVFKIAMDTPLVESKKPDAPVQAETVAPISLEATSQDGIHGVRIQENWIRFDFTNAPSFERTVPAYCCIDGNVFEGRNWVRILVALVEFELAKGNPALEDLYEKSLYGKKTIRPFLMKSRIEGSRNCSELSNGYWINVGWSIPFLMQFIQAFLLHCGYDEKQVVIYGVPKANNSATHESSQTKKTEVHGVDMEKAETFLKTAGLRGATVQELIDAIQPSAVFWSTKNLLDENLNVIAMPDNRYVHADCFVDLDEAEDVFGKILSSHFARFDGYSNNQLLFGAALQELSMFLNDNDCENINVVYAIARYLFEKKAAGKKYKFAPPHIFETEPDYPLNLKGLMIRLARSNGGILHEVDAKHYLQKTMLTYGSIGQLLQVGNDKMFLMYDRDRYLLSEVIGIDDAWCRQMHDRVDDLFRKADVAYVIPRDISEAWLTTLPVLPLGLAWTHLLLQEILDKYPAIGFKSISAGLNQAYHTLAAAFVPIDSPLQTFPDVVTLFMEEHHKLPTRMSGEELRIELRDKGMLEAGEMIYSIHKALNDYRFAWTDENKTVLIRGNK